MNKWIKEELITSCRKQGYNLVSICNNYDMLVRIQNRELIQ